MIPAIRQEKIMEILEERDLILMDDLAEELNISKSTVRRDILKLEKDGDVVMLRGGAVRKRATEHDIAFSKKRLINAEAKEIIGKKAASLVEDGDYLYIDSGTTPLAMVKYLDSKGITIITSNLGILDYLPIKGATCIMLGGLIKEDLGSIVGKHTERMLEEMYFDKAFIGANGYIYEGAIYTYDIRESTKKNMVKERSKKTYVLADKTKENKRAFCKVFDTDSVVIITE